MAETLKKVTSGEIPLQDLIEWLSLETSHKNFGMRFTELKADFTISFINYIRDCNTWLVPGVYKHTQSLESDSKKYDETQENVPPSPCIVKRITDKHASNKRSNASNSKKRAQVLTFSVGCESFRNCNKYRGNNNNQKSTFNGGNYNEVIHIDKPLPNVNDFSDFPEISTGLPFHQKTNQSFDKKISAEFSPKIVQKHSANQSTQCQTLNIKKSDVAFTDKPVIKKSAAEKNKSKPKLNNSLPDDHLHQRRIEPVPLQFKSVTIDSSFNNSVNFDDSVLKYEYPIPTNIHNNEKLYLFEKIYNALFCYGLVPNIFSELYFLLQLLTSSVKSNVNKEHVLSTVHNCVHFSISCLYEQKCLLTLLDATTLKLLCDIPYIKDFSPHLVNFIEAHLNERLIVRTKKRSSIDRVPFCEINDTKPNFPTEESFRSFSKQRNLFYDVLRIWETAGDRYGFDITFEKKFFEKVRTLVDLGTENYNYYHLAQLVYKQLKVSCLHASETLDGFEFTSSGYEALRSLKLSRKLSIFTQTSVVSNHSVNGLQLFFEAFLVTASCVPLNNYLLDLLSCEIMELNNVDNFAKSGQWSVQEVHEKFSNILHTLRLLAQFYGFITFMPYRSLKPLPKRLVITQKELRRHTRPSLDLEQILHDAIQKQCLVLTVPWVVQYLHMMDQVAPTLDSYLGVCKVLVKIYRGHFKNRINPVNYEFIRLVIGSLIDTPNFPLECLFYNYEDVDVKVKTAHPLDIQNIVDEQLVYSCCPYLAKLKLLINNFVISAHDQGSDKNYAKLSTLWGDADQLPPKQTLEMQLEENFFFSHPLILKEAVDIVSERVTSRIVRKIMQKIDNLKKDVVTYISSNCKEKCNKDLNFIYSLSTLESEKLCKTVKKWVSKLMMSRKENETYVMFEVKRVLPQLLSEEFDSQVIDAASKITSRMVIKRVVCWVDNNVIPEKVVSNIKNKVQKVLNTDDVSTCFNEEIPRLELNTKLPFNYLRDLQMIALELDSKYDQFSLVGFLNVCNDCSSIIKLNCLPLYFVETVVWLVTYIIKTIIIYIPEKFNTEVAHKLVTFLLSFPHKLVLPSCFLNQQTLFLFTLKDTTMSWEKLALLFDFAIASGLFNIESLTEFASDLHNYQWTKKTLHYFNTLLRPIMLLSLGEDYSLSLDVNCAEI